MKNEYSVSPVSHRVYELPKTNDSVNIEKFTSVNSKKELVAVQGLGFVGSAMAVAVAGKLNNENEPFFNVTGIDLPSGIGQEKIGRAHV